MTTSSQDDWQLCSTTHLASVAVVKEVVSELLKCSNVHVCSHKSLNNLANLDSIQPSRHWQFDWRRTRSTAQQPTPEIFDNPPQGLAVGDGQGDWDVRGDRVLRTRLEADAKAAEALVSKIFDTLTAASSFPAVAAFSWLPQSAWPRGHQTSTRPKVCWNTLAEQAVAVRLTASTRPRHAGTP